MELLREAGVELKGAEAVVVGRSKLVGKPIVQLLLAEDATVTTAHSRTRDLAEVCRRADVLVAAVGVPRLVNADMVKPGAVVIDVGINRVEEGLVGDVDFDGGEGEGGRDHPGARRGRADDDRDAAREHHEGGAASGGDYAESVDFDRLRFGDWVMAFGGVAVLVVMLFDWYSIPELSLGDQSVGSIGFNAWESFAVNDVILALAAVMALATFVLTASQPTAAVPLALASLTALVADPLRSSSS